MKKVFIIAVALMSLSSVVTATTPSRRRPSRPSRTAKKQSSPTPLQQVPFAVTKFSVRPMLGYGFGAGKEEMGTDRERDAQGEQIKDEVIYYSAGQGIKSGLGIDYNAFKGVAFGVDIGHSMGLRKETDKAKWYSSLDSIWYNSVSEMKTSYLLFGPTVRMEREVMGLTPFCAFGLTFALASKSVSTYQSRPFGAEDMETEIRYRTGMGSCGIVGVKYPLMEALGIVAEIRVDQLSLKASHGKLTWYTVDGEDQLADMTTRDKEADFRDDDTEDNPDDESKPSIEHTFTTPASSVSIRLGVVYGF